MTLVTNETLFSSLFVKRNCTSICSFFFSSFVVQFSRYIRFSLRFSLPFGKLVYYTTSFCVCQVLFESFFNFFQVLVFHSLFSVVVVLQRPLYCITKFSVCQGVLENFLKFFQLLFPYTVFSNFRSLSATCVVYHFFPLLSTLFPNFLLFLRFRQIKGKNVRCFMVYFHENENQACFTYLRGRKKRW